MICPHLGRSAKCYAGHRPRPRGCCGGCEDNSVCCADFNLVTPQPGEEEGCGLLLLPRSKTDQMGEGAYAWLSPDSMRRIGAWLVASGITEGPLFRRVGVDRRRARPARPRRGIADLAPNAHINWEKMAAQSALSARIRYTLGTKPLTRQGVTGMIRRVGRAAADAGLVALMGDDLVNALAALSSHSLRVGLTQDLFAAGEDLGPVSQALRWSSPATALRYARKLAPSSNAAARVLRTLRG